MIVLPAPRLRLELVRIVELRDIFHLDVADLGDALYQIIRHPLDDVAPLVPEAAAQSNDDYRTLDLDQLDGPGDANFLAVRRVPNTAAMSSRAPSSTFSTFSSQRYISSTAWRFVWRLCGVMRGAKPATTAESRSSRRATMLLARAEMSQAMLGIGCAPWRLGEHSFGEQGAALPRRLTRA